MRCPAAPYHESFVAAEVICICKDAGLIVETDSFDNILVRLPNAPSGRPFVLAAHLDHPAFVIREPKNLEAEFLGGVGDEYFCLGATLRLFPGAIKARLGPRISPDKRLFQIVAEEPIVEEPSFAVWDLPSFEVQDDRVSGRACDDLIGAATALHVLANLKESGTSTNVIAVLSRAEEVGLHGALALAGSGLLPPDSLVISLETSRELPPVKMGQGVIIRVGDRASIFDSAFTRYLTEVATDFAKVDARFKFQRALMSGGTCEATAYQECGYRSAAICVALGNYHNCGANHKIEPEFVSLADAMWMSQLLERSAVERPNFDALANRLPQRLCRSSVEAVRDLTSKRLSICGASPSEFVK